MEVVENAGRKLPASVPDSCLSSRTCRAQLEDSYEKRWETFLDNSGLKMFFQIDDDFTRSYTSRQLGEMETTHRTQSGSHSASDSLT
jgi:hypothetical protein